MAFMMPVVKNDYNIYPSCPGSRRGGSGTQSRDSILSGRQSRSSIPSGSPQSRDSILSSPRHSRTFHKSESQSSLHRFHNMLVDKLRKTFRGKDSSADDIHQDIHLPGSTHITIR